MAKFRKGKEFVDCELLTENAGRYVVKFKTGVIRAVDKRLVSNLDRIDEGVLDAIGDVANNIGSTANKYGRKILDTAKKAVEAVRNFFVKTFVIDNFVMFKDENGLILDVSHPINVMEGAKMTDCVNYVPGSGTIGICEALDIKPEAVENFTYDSEYEGAVQFDNFEVSESATGTNSLLKAIFESESRLGKDEKIKLTGTFCDWDQERILNAITNEYMSRYNGNDPNSLPLLIWGAPGIGKTSIMRSVRGLVKSLTGSDISIISINGGNVGADDFTMPAKIAKFLRRNKTGEESKPGFKGSIDTVIKDLPKSWLPVYNPDSDEADPELLNAIANDGGLETDENGKEYINNGPGGIFFIDEYSRMTPAGMDALMQTPTTRDIGSNSTLHFGDRWVIVCAANRKSDMSRRGGSEALLFEAAAKTRFNHCNFVPNPEDWIVWAKKPSSRRKGRTNILSDIINYIESEIKKPAYGDFYEMWKHPNGDLDGAKGTACPRTWEALSETLIDQYLDNAVGKKYLSISEMPKKELIIAASGIVGRDVAERFADFVAQFSTFTAKDAENVWTKGDNCQYALLKQQKLNTANVKEYFTQHIFPMLKDYYPGGFSSGGVSPEAALNFMKFLEACCYDHGQFSLNRFKEISAEFGIEFGVDLRSVTGPYADAANFKEQVVAQNELV